MWHIEETYMMTDMNNRFITIAIAFCCCFMGASHAFGKKDNFAVKVKSAVERIQKEADKDPDTFKQNIVELEKELEGRRDAVEQSVAAAMLASCYGEMTQSYIHVFDEETRTQFLQKKDAYFSRVLADMEALADAKSDPYSVLLEKGKDSDLYENDMLSVLLDFVENHAGWEAYQRVEAYQRACEVYRQRGNINAYAMLKMRLWILQRRVEKRHGFLSAEQHKDSLYRLLQQVKGEEVGADVALEYANELNKKDESILFLQWAEEHVARSRRSGMLRSVLDDLLCPHVQVGDFSTSPLLAGTSSKVKLEYWNCERVTVTIRHYMGKISGTGDGAGLKENGAVVEKRELLLGTDTANVARKAKGLPVVGTAEFSLTLPAGRYVVVAEAAGKRMVKECQVTSLYLIALGKKNGVSQVYVLDKETGRPVSGVKVQCRKRVPSDEEKQEGWENRDVVNELLADAQGMVEVPEDLWVRAVKDDVDYTYYTRLGKSWTLLSEERINKNLEVVTDRGIYRPGQTVKGAVVVCVQNDGQVKVLPSERLQVVACDALGKEVASAELVTNEYGTASFELVLPADCAVGTLALNAKTQDGALGVAWTKVEEYKRPNFEVTFTGKKAGRFGQRIEAEGKAMMLSGVPVQGASVHYTVECMAAPFRWWERDGRWIELAQGELVTDESGRFLVPLSLTDDYLKDGCSLMRFRVKAVVADMNGETHEGLWQINVSDEDCVLEVQMEREIDLAKNGYFQVEAYDANREKIKLQGDYQILYADSAVAQGVFASAERTALPKDLRLGVRYTLLATTLDRNGKKVENRREFILYSSDLPVVDLDKMGTGQKLRPDSWLKEDDFFCTTSREYVRGGYVDLYFSTRETDAYVIYNVNNKNGRLESYSLVTDGTMQHIRLRHQEEWGEKIEVEMMYVRNGHMSLQTHNFVLERPEKELKMGWASFRDKLLPGQQERWTLTIEDKEGKRVSGAEVMAVLYDAALDRIYSHSWLFNSFYREPYFYRNFANTTTSFPMFYLSGYVPRTGGYVREFNSLRGFTYGRSLMNRVMMTSADMALKGRVAGMSYEGIESEVLKENTVRSTWDEGGSKMAMRENFAETAFFLPHQVSDAEGKVDIQFILPESLTEWRFMAFAHTKEMEWDTIRATVVARKELMLRPNLPRFVRVGDKAVLASSVVNQSDRDFSGNVRLRLIDSETGEVVMTEEKLFGVEAGKTAAVQFGFEVKEGWHDLDCELVAAAGNMSDGERNRISVLPTKQQVVETAPFYLTGSVDGAAVEKTIDLTGLFNGNSPTATARQLTIEYTDNPVWMCIEALRSVKNPLNDNAIDYATAWCANARLLRLMDTFPMLEQHENKEELLQNLLQAESKLSELQQEDGGWSWFRGMAGNRYVTLAVCERLAASGALGERMTEMLEQGIRFLDKQELKAYQERRLMKQDEALSETSIRYLSLVSAMQGRVMEKGVQKMCEKYLSLLEKKRESMTLYGVAKGASLLRNSNRFKAADKWVELLKEYLVEKPGQGCFFASDQAHYSWMDYRIPTQVAAMKAIQQKDKNDACLNEMMLWLMTQKQVQKWDNPLNTIDVAEMLLQVSPMEKFFVPAVPRLLLDGVALERLSDGTMNERRHELEGRESNLALQGNVLAAVPVNMLEDGVGQLTVIKTSPGISWGAAYAQFADDASQLKAYNTEELRVQRKLYVQSAAGGEWKAYEANEPLRVGDRLRIRHIITADRDMDFVKVAAQHPACLEPVSQLSGYRMLGGRGGYLEVRDAGFNLFFDRFTRGTSTVDMGYYIVREGTYEVGISVVECEYAKQFGGHTASLQIEAVKR